MTTAIGLKPIIRKAWSPIGERPLVKVHQRYEWTYLYAFVRPKSGEVCWLILPTVNAQVIPNPVDRLPLPMAQMRKSLSRRTDALSMMGTLQADSVS
jgi:hypothetical protein